MHLCIPSVLLPCPGRTPGCPHIPIYVPRAHIPTSPYPHIPISPCPLSHVSDPPRGTFVPSLKGTEKESGSAVTKPTEPRQCGVGTAPPVSPLPPACVPVSPRPPPHQTPMLPSLKMNLRPRLGAQRGAVGLGRGVWGGLCVCVSAHVRAPPFPLQPGEVSRAAGSGAGLGVRACTRVLAQFAHAEPCVPSAVHPPPPCTATHVPHSHTHTIHARRSVAQQHDVGGSRGGQKGGGRSPAGCRLLAASRPAVSRRVGKPLLQR